MKNYVVIDLEMCDVKNSRRAGISKELIQIGAVLLNENYEITDTFMTYVRPAFGVIDERIHKLTGISGEDVKNAPLAREALEMLSLWMPEGAELLAWSENDELQIRREMKAKSISFPSQQRLFGKWVDCQRLFGKKMHSEKSYSLAHAVLMSGIKTAGGFHDALTDARNTALLFRKLRTETEFTVSSIYFEEEPAPLTYNPFRDFFNMAG